MLILLIGLLTFLPIKEILTKPLITGFAVSKVYVSGEEINYSCANILNADWNLFSMPCKSNDTAVEVVLSSISGLYDSIHRYDSNDNADHWKSYNPNLPSWIVNDLTNMDVKNGYWINMINQSNFYLNGTIETPNTISLVSGWNLMGFPTNVSRNITGALSSISGSYTVLWLYNATDSTYYHFNATTQNGTFTDMIPYYGYWINMTKNGIWFIDW